MPARPMECGCSPSSPAFPSTPTPPLLPFFPFPILHGGWFESLGTIQGHQSKNPSRGPAPGPAPAAHMNYTSQYLQSEMAAQGIEVIVLVNCLCQDAIHLGASDLHIEPWEQSIAVRARVNGVLTEVAHLPLELLDRISARFKVMANLVTYQAGMPQDGTALGGPELEGVQLASRFSQPAAAKKLSPGCSIPATAGSISPRLVLRIPRYRNLSGSSSAPAVSCSSPVPPAPARPAACIPPFATSHSATAPPSASVRSKTRWNSISPTSAKRRSMPRKVSITPLPCAASCGRTRRWLW